MMLRRTFLRAANQPMSTLVVSRVTTTTVAPKCLPSATWHQYRTIFLRSRDVRPTSSGLDVQRMIRQRRDYERTRITFLAAGALSGLIAIGVTSWKIKKVLEEEPKKLDAGESTVDFATRKVIVHDKDGDEVVPTGNSTVPGFPRTINLAADVDAGTPSTNAAPHPAGQSGETTEYTLVGLGTRTVSFLSIQVYVVGFYVATADISSLQQRLVKKVNPIATTLVSGEKDVLRATLLDPTKSEEIWEELMGDDIPSRSLFRVVPVRDTDFHHLRDGFVRAIQARASKIVEETKAASAENNGSTDFGESMREFRHIFNRGKVPKQKELILLRGQGGKLSIVYDDGRSAGRQYLGSVPDERLSRALWMNYLGGPKVASQPARESIVDGVIGFVERPVGSVAAQVV